MKASTAGIGLAAVVVILVAVGSTFYSGGTVGVRPSGKAEQTTIEQIIAGRFPTGWNKQGTGGVLVTVRDLTVLYVENENDGDWHVAVTDGNVSAFITEVIPRDQPALGRPVVGSVIDETGVPFCDVQHQNESWHGDTCWEIHPVTAWSLSA